MKEMITIKKNLLIAAVATVGMFFFIGCANISGGGSEAGNARITGSIIDEQGSAAGNVMVQIKPSDFDPVKDPPVDSASIDTTASDGAYRFTVTKGRTYTIQAVHKVLRSRALVAFVEAGDVDNPAPQCTLHSPGAIKVMLPSGVDTTFGYLYIPGTTFFAFLKNANGSVTLDSVPAGIVPSISYSSTKSTGAVIVRQNIHVLPGDTVTIAYSDWAYSKRLYLNTSVSGANFQGNVYGFPVLVRLTANNFDFSQAKTNGEDIRFTKSNGSPLFYEIERWNVAARKAEIWVKVDTVHGNDSDQSITVYWGNAAATNASNGAAVFDTAGGCQGVWHLGEAASDSLHDATANRYNGVSPDTARPRATEGVIGNGRQFNGSSDFITMPNTAEGKLNFPQDGYYTVSAWVFIDTFGAKPQLIVSKGYEQYFLWAANYTGESPFWEFYEFNESTNWEWTRSPATGGQWMLITGVRQGKNQFLYCNGVLVDSVKDAQPWGISRDSLNDLSIGGFLEGIYDPAYEGYCFLRGSVDEVRIISATQSPDWVRLCYMNQRPDDKLVNFK